MPFLAYAGYALLALTPLAFWPGAFTHDDVLKRALVPTAALLIYARVLIPPLRTREVETRQDPTFLALAIAWAIPALSLPALVAFGGANPYEAYWPLVLTASYALLYICTVTGHIGRTFLSRTFPWGVVAVACLVALYGLAQRAGLDPLRADPALENPDREAVSTLGGTTFAGEYLALAMPSAVSLIFVGAGWAARAAAAAASALLLTHLLVTGARGAILGAGAGLGFFLLAGFSKRFGRERRRALSLAPAALAIAAALAVGAAAQKSGAVDILARLRDALHPPPGRDTGLVRREIWKSTLRLARDHPVAGAGVGQYAIAIAPHRSLEEMRVSGPEREPGDMAHNDLLQRFAETGVLGVLGLALVAFTLLRKFAYYLRHHDEAPTYLLCTGFLGSILAALVAGCFGNPFRQPAVGALAWTFLGVVELFGNPRPRYRKRPVTDLRMTGGLCVGLVLMFCVMRGWQLAVADATYQRGLEAYRAARGATGEDRRRRLEDAQRRLKQARDLEPSRWEAQRVIGLSYLEDARDEGGTVDKVRLSEADVHLQRALDLNPNDAEAWNGKGRVRRLEGKILEGRQALERAVALAPVARGPRMDLALACEQDGLPAKALEQYDAILREGAAADAHFGRGCALARLGRFPEAAAAFDEASRLRFRIEGRDTRQEVLRLDFLGGFRESDAGKAWMRRNEPTGPDRG